MHWGESQRFKLVDPDWRLRRHLFLRQFMGPWYVDFPVADPPWLQIQDDLRRSLHGLG